MAKEIQKLKENAERLYNESKFGEIIILLNDESLNKHKDAQLYCWRARAHGHLKEYDEAYKYSQNAIDTDNNYWGGYFLRAAFWRIKGEYDKAIVDYTKAIELKPDYESAYFNRGISWYEKGDYDKAIADYTKAIELKTDYEAAYNNRGISWKKQGEYEKAIADYTKAIELKSDNQYAYFNRGLIFKKSDQYENAIDDFKNFIACASANDNIWLERANLNIQELTKLLSNKKLDKISEDISNIKKLLLFEDGCITHYTSLSVTKLLLLNNDSKFHISEGAFLNDTSEGRELFKYLDIQFTIEKKDYDTVAEPFTQKPFIGSFVEENKHDDLNLWRMYGKEEKEEARGCALTIKSKELIEGINKLLSPTKETDIVADDINFYRVAYRLSDKANEFTVPGLAKKVITELNSLLKKLKEKVRIYGESDENKKDLEEYINTIAFLFKSDVYRSENEIRLVVKGVGFKKEIDIETTPPGVYINLVNIKPMIEKITLGPKVAKPDEWAAAFYYSYDKIENKPGILISHLPFK